MRPVKKVKKSLIKQIRRATEAGYLQEPFTVEDVRKWVEDSAIVKDDGSPYAKSSISSLLSNSATRNRGSSNRNFKCLVATINQDGKHEYCFLKSFSNDYVESIPWGWNCAGFRKRYRLLTAVLAKC